MESKHRYPLLLPPLAELHIYQNDPVVSKSIHHEDSVIKAVFPLHDRDVTGPAFWLRVWLPGCVVARVWLWVCLCCCACGCVRVCVCACVCCALRMFLCFILPPSHACLDFELVDLSVGSCAR